jgi:hypothetical protein
MFAALYVASDALGTSMRQVVGGAKAFASAIVGGVVGLQWITCKLAQLLIALLCIVVTPEGMVISDKQLQLRYVDVSVVSFGGAYP